MNIADANTESIGFRPVSIDSDVHLLLSWLADDDVSPWYDEGEQTEANYRTRFGPDDHVHKFMMCVDGAPIGYIQAYWLHDEPAYAAQIALPHDAVSIDLFIGSPRYRGGGWGSLLLRTFLERVVFGEMGADVACINPDPANARAVRSYEKVGFRGDRVVEIEADDPGNAGPERIMVLARDAFFRGEAGYGSWSNGTI